MTIYSYDAVTKLMNHYIENGGAVYELEEGSLAQGLTVCVCDGYKTAVIKEVYLNEWSSGQTVRLYNRIPKKYDKMIDDLWEKWEKEEA